MNEILKTLKSIIQENLKQYLPEVKQDELEEDGAIYYMNGKNGTEWDWYINEHLPNLMVFYNDEQQLGALKLTIYDKGDIEIYIYDEKGNNLKKEIHTSIDIAEEEIFKLAVALKKETDDKRIWDENIEKINTEINISEEDINEFKKTKEYMQPTINRNNLMKKNAYVSKKITEEGYKVGYMARDESLNENDSGWAFMAGNEDEEYNNDYRNIALLSIYQVYQLDPDIWEYIDNPIGSEFIRISSDKFEVDKKNKKIYIEKR